jgi:HAD superfamily hydrolase (TIGR01509 family)
MIRHISFDFGNVGCEQDLEGAVTIARKLWTDYTEADFTCMRKAIVKQRDYWREKQNGLIDEDTYLSAACEAGDIEPTEANKTHFHRALIEFYSKPYQPVLGLVERLQVNGYGTSVLSNYNEIANEAKGIEIMRMVPVVVQSCDVGVSKPHPKMYETLLDRIAVDDPSEVLFIDDKLENIQAARRQGINGFHFDISGTRTMDNAYKDLCTYLKDKGVNIT